MITFPQFGQIYASAQAPTFWWKLPEDAAMIYWEHLGAASATFIGVKNFKNNSLPGSLQSAQNIKVICQKPHLAMLRAHLGALSINPEKWVEREVNCEIIFHAEQNRLQVGRTPSAPALDVHTSLSKKIKVLIVDDSKTVQLLLKNIFSRSPNIEIVAMALNPLEVEGLINTFRPDVITLDIHMPQMNGIELLKSVISKYQIPTIMISSISMQEGTLVMEALSSGAIDYLQKPSLEEIEEMAPRFIEKVEFAATVNLKNIYDAKKTSMQKPTPSGSFNPGNGIVLIGSSTGGTQALQEIFERLPENIPPIIVVQHIPAVFSKALADRLNGLCSFTIKEAEDQEPVVAGKILIAPGGKQLALVKINGELRVEVNDQPAMNRFRPSVDYMFLSWLKIIDRPTLGIILTGMGKDGAQGLLKLKQKGAFTMAQDQNSSVVFGMPKEAIRIGAADLVSPLLDIPNNLVNHYNKIVLKKAG